MASPKGFILYRIWYGKNISYLGRTKQPLQTRIHGHLFHAPMHRTIDIHNVTKIEYAEFQTEADMFVYEVFFINTWKPSLNVDDKAGDSLTISLPPVEWKLFEIPLPLWEKWKIKIEEQDVKEKKRQDLFLKQAEIYRKHREGKISEKEHSSLMKILRQEMDEL